MIMNLKNAVSTMSHFVNDTSSVVNDAIDGLLLQSNGALARLDAFPRVVVRADWQRDRVALIAGGGSGHEPSHAGFVSDGLLTAAVCGDLFASPPVEAVLAAIRHVASREHGAVLIVKSYTGDRLNFALAMERARVLGFPVEMIVVEDDVALPDASRARGIAGTLFVHKICGYFAQRREPLARVVAEGRAVAGAVRSMGVALTSCALPGRASGDNRIAPGMMELGMGIHGERGAATVPLERADPLVARIAAQLLDGVAPDARFACVLNNLGGTSVLEMSLLVASLARSPLRGRIDLLIGPASLMTSSAMHGFSLSIVPLVDSERSAALLAPVAAAAWCAARPLGGAAATAKLEPLPSRVVVPSANVALERIIQVVCKRLIAAEAQLNELDRQCGDGDTGTAIASGCRATLDALPTLALADTASTLESIGDLWSLAAGGSIGVLSSIFFTASAKALRSGQTLVDALIDGQERVSQSGGARLGDRTLLDALVPALHALRQGVTDAVTAAKNGAAGTAKMPRARAGRSEYIGGDLLGIVDPGALAIAMAFESIV
jgi:dihydroxyacetone kinase